MTVCIAAICKFGGASLIVGASDRLVTYGDTEYEQQDPKIIQLASNTVILMAGSPQDHAAICVRAIPQIAVLTLPTVEQIANIYANEYAYQRRTKAEIKYLMPLGLSTSNFLNNQANLSPSVANRLLELLQKERLASQAIIAGTDQTGAHIYIVDDPGEATSYEMEGWAAIGYGERHADLQFISEKFHPGWPFDAAFLLTYLAKKKADITPGVGGSTDLFWIAPTEGYRLLRSDEPIFKLVQELHRQIVENERSLGDAAKEEIREYVDGEISKQQATSGQQQIEAADQAGSRDTAEVSRGSEESQPEA